MKSQLVATSARQKLRWVALSCCDKNRLCKRALTGTTVVQRRSSKSRVRITAYRGYSQTGVGAEWSLTGGIWVLRTVSYSWTGLGACNFSPGNRFCLFCLVNPLLCFLFFSFFFNLSAFLLFLFRRSFGRFKRIYFTTFLISLLGRNVISSKN